MRRFSRCAWPLLPSQGQVREVGEGRPESLHRSRGLPGASGFARDGVQGQAGRAESCGEIAYAARFSRGVVYAGWLELRIEDVLLMGVTSAATQRYFVS